MQKKRQENLGDRGPRLLGAVASPAPGTGDGVDFRVGVGCFPHISAANVVCPPVCFRSELRTWWCRWAR